MRLCDNEPTPSAPLAEVEISTDLICRYDQPGPRYTSYPTAVQFDENYDEKAWREDLEQASQEHPDAPASLYIHLPFCQSLCWFCACNTVITSRRERAIPYLDRVTTELERISPWAEGRGEITQVHLGGGTPSYLAASEIERLCGVLGDLFSIAPDAECSVEIDPRDVDDERLSAFAAGGFRRLSVGVQDFDPEVQRTINRIQPESMTRQTIDSARAIGFSSVNIDLIYGLPHQTLERFDRSLQSVIEIGPDRIALFNYAHVPWLKKHQKMIPVESLPTPEQKIEIFLHSIRTLCNSGYRHIGMDHFARPDDELAQAQDEGRLWRNFQGYTTRSADLYSVGTSAISMLDGAYSQNTKTLREYERAIDGGGLATQRGIRLFPDDRLRRHCIMRLMCDFRLVHSEVASAFPDADVDPLFEAARSRLTPMAEDGLLRIDPDGFEILPVGQLLIRNICMAFDAYLVPGGEDSPRFSRTV